MFGRPGLRQFCAEEEDQGRVVDPRENDYQRSGGAVCRANVAHRKVEADSKLSDDEQHGGDEGAKPHVAPGDLDVGQEFEHQGKQDSDHARRGHKVYHYEEGLQRVDLARHVNDPSYGGAHGERDEQQEAGAEYRGK